VAPLQTGLACNAELRGNDRQKAAGHHELAEPCPHRGPVQTAVAAAVTDDVTYGAAVVADVDEPFLLAAFEEIDGLLPGLLSVRQVRDPVKKPCTE
jgi:hypothetical protein